MKDKVKWPLKKVVEVTWQDSNSYSRWAPLTDYAENHHTAACKTVGYLLKKDKQEVTIIMTQSDVNEGDGMQGLAIPLGCVTRIRVIE